MSLSFNELKQLILDDAIYKAEVIANKIGNEIILTGLSDNDKMYVYDKDTISYKKNNKSNDTILTIVSSLISTSIEKLDNKERKELDKMCGRMKISSNSQINEYLPQLRYKLANNTNNIKFDKYINEIHFINGKYLIDKGIFVEREFGKDFITEFIRYKYEEPSIESINTIDVMLNQIYGTAEDKNCMLLYFGSSLTGQAQRDQRMLFMVGEGSSGKSTVCKFSEISLECYAYQMGSELFNEKNTNINKILNTFDHHPVIRIVIIPEIKGDITASSLYKTLVEGEASTTKLYQDGEHKIEHQARIFAPTNELPKIKHQDTGMDRRYDAYPHKSKFLLNGEQHLVDLSKRLYIADKQLLEKFKSNINLKLAWFKILADKAKEWLDNNMIIKTPDSFKSLKAEIQENNDVSKDFIDGFIIKTDNPKDVVGKDKMLAIFKRIYPTKFLTVQQLISILTKESLTNKLKYDKGRRAECEIRGVYVGVRINEKNIKKFLKENNNIDNDVCMFNNQDSDDDNNDDEYEKLSELYDKKDKQLDDMNEKYKRLESLLNMAKEIMNMRQTLDEQIKRRVQLTNGMFNLIEKLDNKYQKQIAQLTETVNELSMRVASLEVEGEFSDDESDNMSETESTLDPDNNEEDESDDFYNKPECECGWRSEYEESHVLYSLRNDGCDKFTQEERIQCMKEEFGDDEVDESGDDEEYEEECESENMFIKSKKPKKVKDEYTQIADNIFLNETTGKERTLMNDDDDLVCNNIDEHTKF